MKCKELAQKIIDGKRLKRGDDLTFLIDSDLDELCEGADCLREHFCGNKVDLCTIINGRSGRCPENCKYCAQSAHNKACVEEYDFLPVEKILAEAKANESEGVNRFSIVTAGRSLSGDEFDHAIETYEAIRKECHINLCASMGFLTREQFRQLKKAGVTRYHDNIETSRRFFPEICTTHTFEQKIEEIKIAKEEGMTICSGGIIGMGETFEDRIDMALTLSEIGVDSIPINALMPIPGTPLENRKPLSEEDILRTMAIFRYINPEAIVRMAAGRGLVKNTGERLFTSGVNAIITGNMLTTTGSTIQSDKAMLSRIGRDTTPDYK